MDLHRMTLSFLLFLPLNLSFEDQRVFMEKHIDSEVTDRTPLCTTGARRTTVLCKIQRGDSGADLCYLRYIPGQRNESGCGSRITLIAQNQAVYLHLMSVTPEDSGMYNCVCYNEVIKTIHLNITVEDFRVVPVKEEGKTNNKTLNINNIILSSSIAVLIITCGVIASCFYKRICCRQQAQPSTREAEEMDMYAALQQPNKDLYQTIVTRNSAQDSHLQRGRDYENDKDNKS